jgi:hypothetical protein
VLRKARSKLLKRPESSQEDVDVDPHADEDLAEDAEVDESVTVDLGDMDAEIDAETGDTDGIEGVEVDVLAELGDEPSSARTLAIRRELEERNERRRMAEDLDYLDFDD